MDSRDIAEQMLLKELQFLRRANGATWRNYQCTMLLTALWNCQNELDYKAKLISTIAHHVHDKALVEFVYSAFGLSMSYDSAKTPTLGKRRGEIATLYGISVTTVTRYEDKCLREVAAGIVDDYPQLHGVKLPRPTRPLSELEYGRLVLRALGFKVNAAWKELDELGDLQLRLRKRVGNP